MTTPPITRPDPSTHWSDTDRRKVLELIQAHPGIADGPYLQLHRPKSVKRLGMALMQFEREDLIKFDDVAWFVTDTGLEFLAGL